MRKMEAPAPAPELTGCVESIAELLRRFEADVLRLPPTPPRHREERFAAALRARMIFSWFVDADFLDTEKLRRGARIETCPGNIYSSCPHRRSALRGSSLGGKKGSTPFLELTCLRALPETPQR